MKKSNVIVQIQDLLYRSVLFVLFIGILLSCQDEVMRDNHVKHENTVILKLSMDEGNAVKIKKTGSSEIPVEEAINMVRQVYMKNARTKSGGDYVIKSCKKVPLKSSYFKNIEETGYYVIEFTNGTQKGFSLTSADWRSPEIFAYSENGSISDTTYNNGLKMFCQLLPGYLMEKVSRFNTDSLYNATLARLSSTKSGWIDDGPTHYMYMQYGFVPDRDFVYMGEEIEFSYTTEKYLFLTTQWGQEAPYNNALPLITDTRHAYVGCQILATLQIMAYHKKPYSNVTVADWTRFSQYPNSFDTKLQECVKTVFNAYQKEYVNTSGTGTTNSSALTFFKSINYSVGTVESYDGNRVLSALNFGPAMATGRTSDNKGHTWVIDGYKSSKNTYYDKYEKDDGYDIWRIYVWKGEEGIATNVHCNWGYSGFGDGWFKSGVFEHWEGSDGFSFPNKLEIFTKIQPN